MYKFIILFFLFLIPFQVSAQWQKVNNDKIGFTAALPQEYEVENDTTDSRLGKIYSTIYSALKGRDSYTLNCTKYPSDFLSKNKAAILKSGPSNFASGVNGEIIMTESVEKNGFDGIQYSVEGKNSMYFYSEVYVVNDYLFQLSVSKWEEVGFDDKLIARFFNSFEPN